MSGLGIIEWAAGTLLTVAGIWTAWWAGKKSKAEAEATADPRTPYEALAQRMVNLERADTEKAAKIREHTRKIDQQAAEITYWTGRVDSLTERVATVEEDRDALSDALRPIAEWDDAGRPDPPGFPGIAAHARHVLDRLHNH